MENLKKVLRMTGNENINSLKLNHEEFVQMYKLGKVDYRLPKRYINLFYRLYIDKWKQIVVQVLLLLFWGGIIFGIYLLFKKEWIYAVLSIIGGWTIKQLTNVFILNSIKKGLFVDKKYYSDLLNNGIIGIYKK
ncbi:MAG: hypothetical protein BWX96_00621 [Bacteroidetes bacterium ADurb.Bin145]|jgi:hypothetical protein|nr:MAG: hypothetical protein BWX96_00621 [Bacteroidetes bacterium ADurb.Bin145]